MQEAANYGLYAGIAAAGYVGSVKFPSDPGGQLQWWAGLVGVTLLAIKAKQSKSNSSDPAAVTVVNQPDQPVPTESTDPKQ
jgi:hypothetical protein